MAAGLSRNEALKQAARLRGLTKKAAYQLLLEEQKGEESNREPEAEDDN
jgi:hypothetical protein